MVDHYSLNYVPRREGLSLCAVYDDTEVIGLRTIHQLADEDGSATRNQPRAVVLAIHVVVLLGAQQITTLTDRVAAGGNWFRFPLAISVFFCFVMIG